MGRKRRAGEEDRRRPILEIRRRLDDADDADIERRTPQGTARVELVPHDLLLAERHDLQAVPDLHAQELGRRFVHRHLIHRPRVREPTLGRSAPQHPLVAGPWVGIQNGTVLTDWKRTDEGDGPRLGHLGQLSDRLRQWRPERLAEYQLGITAEVVRVTIGCARRPSGTRGKGKHGTGSDTGQQRDERETAPLLSRPRP